MSDTQHHETNYIGIFCLLAVAMAVSLGLGFLSPSPVVITTIFAIAAAKAYLVLGYYMHLTVQPKFVKVMVVSLFAVLAILWIGLVPDIVYVYGGESPAELVVGGGEHVGHDSSPEHGGHP